MFLHYEHHKIVVPLSSFAHYIQFVISAENAIFRLPTTVFSTVSYLN